MEGPKIVLLIFTSGKIVLAGAKNRNDIYKAYYKMYPVLRQYRKQQNMTQLERTKIEVMKLKRNEEKKEQMK